MRDFITIRQKAFYEFLQHYNKDKPKEQQIQLDLKDLVIFEYIAQFCLSDNEKIKNNRITINGKEYTHIAYKKIIEDNPFLNFKSKRNLIRSIEKLQHIGLIEKVLSKNNGNKTYFTLGHLSQYLMTNLSEGYRQNCPNPIDKNVNSLMTDLSHNSKYNIDSKKIESKNRKPIYIGSLSDFEKKLLRVISNLQDLFTRYRLPIYPTRDYYTAYKEILKKGYTEKQLLRAIYARVYKATNDGVDTYKFLETLSNPKYTLKSIDQLIIESEAVIKQLELSYDEEDEYYDDILHTQFLKECYYYDYTRFLYDKVIDKYGWFEDIDGESINLKDLEYDIYLMKQYLSNKGYELTTEGITTSESGIRYFIVNNALDNIPYYTLMKRFLYGLLISDKDREIDLGMYEEVDCLNDFYNEYLRHLKTTDSLDDIVPLLEEKIKVEV